MREWQPQTSCGRVRPDRLIRAGVLRHAGLGAATDGVDRAADHHGGQPMTCGGHRRQSAPFATCRVIRLDRVERPGPALATEHDNLPLREHTGEAAAEVYDIVTDQWKTLPELPTPRGGFPGVFTQGQVVVLGGERGTRAFDTVEAYDPARGEWRALPPMPTARHGLAAVVIGGAIYAIGGSTQARVAENTGANEAIRANPPT